MIAFIIGAKFTDTLHWLLFIYTGILYSMYTISHNFICVYFDLNLRKKKIWKLLSVEKWRNHNFLTIFLHFQTSVWYWWYFVRAHYKKFTLLSSLERIATNRITWVAFVTFESDNWKRNIIMTANSVFLSLEIFENKWKTWLKYYSY